MLYKCLNLREKKYAYWNGFSFRLLKFNIINKTSQFHLERHEIHVTGEKTQSSVIQQYRSAPLLVFTELPPRAWAHRGTIWSLTEAALVTARDPQESAILRQKAGANCLSQHPKFTSQQPLLLAARATKYVELAFVEVHLQHKLMNKLARELKRSNVSGVFCLCSPWGSKLCSSLEREKRLTWSGTREKPDHAFFPLLQNITSFYSFLVVWLVRISPSPHPS